MSVPRRVRGVKVLKAVSSPLRLQILNLLFDKGPLSYTELMNSLKMNPSRDAGRFAYHLKFLLKTDLIEADVEARKYCLTELGKMVIDVADRVEKKVFRPRELLVRASRFALEEFDANRIADSLIKEAKMPSELAQKVAKEAEKRLLKSKTNYLTAPLVREVTNAILIEKGLEDYRHKLTRLGLPVHEVHMLVEARNKDVQGSASVHELAGEAVLREYMLLKVFPRDIADAHLSGALHVDNLGSWVLKPSEVMHDLRFFYHSGLGAMNPHDPCLSRFPLRDLSSVLSATFDVLLHSSKEVTESQTLDYFNVFLAPFVKGSDPKVIKEALRIFICTIRALVNVSLGLELVIPRFVADKQAVGPLGKPTGCYNDVNDEAQLLASLILDVFAEESQLEPILNPKIIVKIRPESLSDVRAKALLLKAHCLASDKGIVYFACLTEKPQEQAVFSGSGCRFGVELNGDWELDTLRLGCLGIVSVNLPRIVYECEGDKVRLFEMLKDRLEMADRALEIKYAALKQRGRILLPFIMQDAAGDRYFRLDVSSRLTNLTGLGEAVQAFCGKSLYEDEKALDFACELAQCALNFVQKSSRRRGKRLLPAVLYDVEASERLVRLDIERFGFGKVRFSGSRERPRYSTFGKVIVQNGQVPQEFLKAEQRLHGLHAGGSLTVVELGDAEHKPEELMALTLLLAKEGNIEYFTHNRRLTRCVGCKKSWLGSLHKCPSCGAMSTLSVCDRYAS